LEELQITTRYSAPDQPMAPFRIPFLPKLKCLKITTSNDGGAVGDRVKHGFRGPLATNQFPVLEAIFINDARCSLFTSIFNSAHFDSVTEFTINSYSRYEKMRK
jgi:hypothetical protein